MRIEIDADRCTGHGRCYTLVPELFEADDEGHSRVLAEQVPDGLEDRARTAAQNCPEQAISLVE